MLILIRCILIIKFEFSGNFRLMQYCFRGPEKRINDSSIKKYLNRKSKTAAVRRRFIRFLNGKIVGNAPKNS